MLLITLFALLEPAITWAAGTIRLSREGSSYANGITLVGLGSTTAGTAGSAITFAITNTATDSSTLNITDIIVPANVKVSTTALNITDDTNGTVKQTFTLKIAASATANVKGKVTIINDAVADYPVSGKSPNPFIFYVNGTVKGTDTNTDTTDTETTNILTFTPPSNGNVSSNTKVINCGNGNTNCSADYSNGNSVILNAIANTGTIFTSWGGDCSGSTNPLILPMDADKNCTANFTITVDNPNGNNGGETTPTVDLTVNPSTNGFVISQPPGISCGTGITDCQAGYIKDNTVVLIAKADQGATFNGWDDDCSGTTSPIVIAMDGAQTCTANFVITPTSPEIQVLDGETDIVAGINVTNFGITAIGTSLSKIFTVKNIGNAELTLASTIFFIGDGFTAGKFGTTTLAPSATTTFTVTLDAITAGNYSNIMYFANNDSDEDPFGTIITGVVEGNSDSIQSSKIQVFDSTTDIYPLQ